MRGFASYLVAGILVVLALDFVAPPVGLGLAVGAWPVVERGATHQFIDRTLKGDRLSLPVADGKQQTPSKPPVVLIDCDPASSPLSEPARVNIPGLCVAERTVVRPVAG